MALPRALRAYAPRAHQLCCSSAARRVLSTGGAPGRSFPGVFGVYKGKAALQVKLLPPTWIQGQGGRSLEREVPGRRHTHDDRLRARGAHAWPHTTPPLAPAQGSVLLEATAAVGTRKYDWANKIVRALSTCCPAHVYHTSTPIVLARAFRVYYRVCSTSRPGRVAGTS
jgi:hypothetical protein